MSDQLGKINFPQDEKWSHYELDLAAYQIFVLLQQHPTIPVSQLSEELGYSTTLVNARLDYLKQQGFLRPDREILVPFLGQRWQTEAEVVYNPHALGLTRMNVFLTSIPRMESLRKLETFLAIHPYSHYHVATFGTQASLYCQFDLPPTAKSHLDELLQLLQSQNYFGSYSSIEQAIVAKSSFDYSRFELGSNQWTLFQEHEFLETSFDSEMDLLWKDFRAHDPQSTLKPSRPQMRFRFDTTDMQLLRELTVNAKISITDLAQHYEISRSRISRRVKRLRELVVSNERLIYDPSVFDLTYAQIITGSFADADDLSMETFHTFLEHNYLPFSTTVVMNAEQFIWFTLAPPSIVPQMTRFAWQHATDISVHQLALDTSRTYYFPHHNLRKRGEWRDNRDYLIDTPLETFGKLQKD